MAAAVLAAAGVGGYLLQGRTDPDRSVSDRDGQLSVTVPDSWEGAVADDGWVPPGSTTSYAALSVGTDSDWTDDATGQGVFLGVLPTGTEFPAAPAHPECESAGEPLDKYRQGRPSVKITYSGCPGSDVVIERVEQIARNRLLWVQIRSDDEATANQVLDSVETHGL